MITLNVYFTTENDYIGTAYIIENLITNEVQLELSSKLYLDEIKVFIDKAVKLLKSRYKEIKVEIHWDSPREKEENDNDQKFNRM